MAKGRRIETYTTLMGSLWTCDEEVAHVGSQTIDVCRSHSIKTIEKYLTINNGNGWLHPNPKDNNKFLCYSTDFDTDCDHPPYDDDDYACEACGATLWD